MEVIKHSRNIVKASSQRGLNADRQFNFFQRFSDLPLWTKRMGVDISTLYELMKESPEIVRCIQVRIEDMLSNRWKFIEGSQAAAKKADAFCRDQGFFKKFSDALWDVHITGWGFILKLKFTEDEVKSIVARAVKSNVGNILFNSSMSETATINKITAQIMASDAGRTKGLQVLSADTIRVNFDDSGKLTKIFNRVGTMEKEFDPKDVIVLSFYNPGGRVYPFTPAMTLLNDAAQLIDSKAYSGNVLKNKGLPPMGLVLPDAMGEDDPNVQHLKREVRSYRNNKENWGRVMVLSGNINPVKFESEAKDLEYPKLIAHWTRLVISTWGIPFHRIPWSDPDTKAVPPKESNEGYYSGINFHQNILEETIYNQLWKEFNVFMKFHRGYMIDELRNANVVSMLADRRLISMEEARELVDLGLPRDFPEGETEIDPRKQDEGNTFDEDKDDRGETPMGDEGKDKQDNKTRSVEIPIQVREK